MYICFVFGKSARMKISCKLGCHHRDRIGLASQICFNRGKLNKMPTPFQNATDGLCSFVRWNKKGKNDGMSLLLFLSDNELF